MCTGRVRVRRRYTAAHTFPQNVLLIAAVLEAVPRHRGRQLEQHARPHACLLHASAAVASAKAILAVEMTEFKASVTSRLEAITIPCAERLRHERVRGVGSTCGAV